MPTYEVEIEHRADDQVFSYYHGDELLHFNTSLLARLRRQMPTQFKRITMEIGVNEYNLVMEHRGIEEPKVAALKAADLREPGYGVFMPNGSFTIVDGHHRLVRRFRAGVRVMDFWVTYEGVWHHCLVEYGPVEKAILAEALPPKSENPDMIASAVIVHNEPTDEEDDQ